jgi:hypothetical protein
LLPLLEKQATDSSWELQGQLLILSANGLMQFNQSGSNAEEINKELLNDNKTDGNTTEEKKETIVKSSINPDSSMISQHQSQRKARDFQTASTVQT